MRQFNANEHTMLLRRWINVIDVDSTSQHCRVPNAETLPLLMEHPLEARWYIKKLYLECQQLLCIFIITFIHCNYHMYYDKNVQGI